MGGQWKRQELTNTDTIGRATIDYAGNAVSGSSLEVDTWALFVEDELKLHRTLALDRGARAWTTMRSSAATSARVRTWLASAEQWTIRGGVSKGFRAPSLTENSATAATQSGGRGCTSLIPLGYTRGGCYMAGNPDLDPETSTNREIGISFDNDLIDVGVTYFHTTSGTRSNTHRGPLQRHLVDAHEQRAARAHQRHGRQLQRPLRRAVALAHLGNLDEGSRT